MRVQTECKLSGRCLSLFFALAGVFISLSCSSPNAVNVPGIKVGAKDIGAAERLNQTSSGDANSKSIPPTEQGSENGDGGAGAGGEALQQPELSPFASAEVNAETLIAYSSLSATSVSQLISADVGVSTQSFICGFVATDADLTQRLLGRVEAAGWSLPQQGNLSTRSAANELLSVESCRCRVRQLADQHRAYLVPVSLQ